MRGLIFDMDGTMVDNMMVHHQAWKDTFSKLGIEMSISEVKEKVHGVNHEILERLFGAKFSPAERLEISSTKEENYRRIYRDKLVLIPGLEKLLSECVAHGIPMAVATAAPPENVDFVLDNLALRPYFDGIFHANSVQNGKPDPEVFLLAAEKMNMSIKDCLIFEDSLTGAEAAHRAGTKALIVTTTHGASEFGAYDHIVQFIEDYQQIHLPNLLAM